MIEKELFIKQYNEICKRFKKILNVSNHDVSDKYDELLRDADELLDVLPSVEGVDVKHWVRKIEKLKGESKSSVSRKLNKEGEMDE